MVVDAGRRHVTSFTTLHSEVATVRPRRPASGVVIALPDGTTTRVPRRHLALVAPDHPLSPEPDSEPGTWIVQQLGDWDTGPVTVAGIVPPAFPAVAQVLHPWHEDGDPGGRPVRWSQVATRSGLPNVQALALTGEPGTPEAPGFGQHQHSGELDWHTAGALVELLQPATSTPDDTFVAVWEGWGDVPAQRFPGAARLPVPYREHFLLRGPLQGVLRTIAVSPDARPVSGIWWPADRAWIVRTEIDFAWTFVAGTRDLVTRLVGHPDLEAAATRYDSPASRPTR